MKITCQSIIFILFFVATSCDNLKEKCNNMPEQIIGTGLIIPNALIPHINEFNHNYGNEGYIINCEEENNFELSVSYDNEKTFENIDFVNYTVLGRHASGNCQVIYKRNVSKNEVTKKYIYTILVVHCGYCKSRDASMNWVLVPKIENDFTVEFIVEYERQKGK